MKGKRAVAAILSIGVASMGHAAASIQLVQNGDFEASDHAQGWTQSSGARTLIDDWSADSPVSTFSAFLGGYNNADDELSTVIQTSTSYSSALLSFDLTDFEGDFIGFDRLDVFFGGSLIDRIDLGNDDVPNEYSFGTHVYDLSAFMDGSQKTLLFKVTTDGSDPCEAYIDNVSLAASTPEPATMAALALGLTPLLCRRRRR